MSSLLFTTHPVKKKLESKQAGTSVNLSTDLHHACRRGEVSRLKSILSQCHEDQIVSFINNRDQDTGLTAISTAVIRGHRNIVLFLLSLGADLSIYDFQYWSPLHWAIHLGHIEIACHLIRSGAKIDASLTLNGAEKKGLLTDSIVPISPFQLSINSRFTLVDQFIHDKTNSKPSNIAQINQYLAKARVDNKPEPLEVAFSIMQPTFTSTQLSIWNMYSILQHPKQCIDFATKCLQDEPIPSEFGTVDLDVDNDNDDDSLYLDDSSDDE